MINNVCFCFIYEMIPLAASIYCVTKSYFNGGSFRSESV